MYLKQGVNLVPINKGDGKSLKIPGWNMYCDEKYIGNIPTDQDFAVMMGHASGNLICLDFDHCDSLDVINDVFGDCINRTLVVRSGNGYHIYLRTKDIGQHDNGKPISTIYLHKEIDGKTYNLELKSHGSYVIGASSDHYDKNDNGDYFKTGKKYNVISNIFDIKVLLSTHTELLQQLKDKGWVNKSEVKVGPDGTYVEKESIMELTMRKWGHGERYNNGWRVALHRLHSGWDYEKIMKEAHELNEKCCDPPHPDAEVVRWVNGAIPVFEKNKTEKDSPYFKTNRVTSDNDSKKEEIANTADKLLEKYHFKTYKDTDELLVWDGKVYDSLMAESIVREECELEITDCTQHSCSEVIAKIKRSSYVTRDKFNFYPCKQCEGTGQVTQEEDDTHHHGMCENCNGVGKFNIITMINGVLNIDTMEFKPHDHRNLATFFIPVVWDSSDDVSFQEDINYDKIAELLKDTKFFKYIKECFTINGVYSDDSRKDVYTALETMAYILLPNNAITKTVMMVGSGGNGKTVLLEYIDSMFGKKNITHIPIQEIAEGGFVLSRLDGKLANIFADIESTEMRKSGKLKQIIGGEGIEVQRKYQDPYTMYSRAKFIFSANVFPRTYDQTDGFFRRFVVLQWKRHFGADEKDIHLSEKLNNDQQEKTLVFKVLVQLARDINKRGDFRYVKPINEIRTTWNELADPILMFIQNRIVEDGNGLVNKRDMYADYHDFCTANEMTPLRIGKFAQEFKQWYDEVVERDKSSGVTRRYWSDCKLLPKPKQDGAMDKFT